jgi:hypothetical protein
MDKILDLIEELWRALRGERREPVLVPVPVRVRLPVRR